MTFKFWHVLTLCDPLYIMNWSLFPADMLAPPVYEPACSVCLAHGFSISETLSLIQKFLGYLGGNESELIENILTNLELSRCQLYPIIIKVSKYSTKKSKNLLPFVNYRTAISFFNTVYSNRQGDQESLHHECRLYCIKLCIRKYHYLWFAILLRS